MAHRPSRSTDEDPSNYLSTILPPAPAVPEGFGVSYDGPSTYLNTLADANKATGGLQGQILGALRPGVRAGIGSALDLLSQGGRDFSGESELARRDIEAERQILQQDISQQGARGGATGTFASSALAALGNQAASRKKQDLAISSALAQDTQRRKDLAMIFQDLFQQSGVNLVQGRTEPLPKDTNMSTWENVFQSVGAGLGTYANSLAGGASSSGLYLGHRPGRG